MEYTLLKELLYKHECKHSRTHLTAFLTFSSFGPGNKKEYPWESRTYLVSSDNKVFQPNKGGYSIYGSCLDGTDQCVRLEQYIREEYGGEDGWVVADCGIVGYLLIECSDCGISVPKLFYIQSDAVEAMLTQLAEKNGLSLEKLKEDYSVSRELFEEGWYGAGVDSAWLADQHEDWHWKIQPVYISNPLNISFGYE